MPISQIIPAVQTASSGVSSSSSRPVLKQGSKGAAVKELQTLLNQAGFSCGAADGSFGPATFKALRSYQRAHGLSADGVAGPKTWSSLLTGTSSATPAPAPTSSSGSHPVLKQGSKGAAVKELQTLLNKAGFSCGTADGSFGPATAKALRSFQSSRGLTADGVAGPKTWNALLSGGITTPTTTPTTTPSTSTPASGSSTHSVLKQGAKGAEVKQLQTLLNQAGFSCGTADGSFGPATAKALRSYQGTRGLSADGVAGPATWRALETNAPAVNDHFDPGATSAPADLQTPIMSGKTTTNLRSTSRSVPVNAPIRSTVGNRSASLYSQVVRQFDVPNNPRHLKTSSSTYCNIFAWDVMRAMDVQLPHWVDSKGTPTAYNASGSHELNANATVKWLTQHGAEYGWRKVSMSEASRYANQGKPALVIWKNPNAARSGHVAVVIPSSDGQTHIAQAGGTNTNDRVIKNGSTFGTAGTIGEDCYFWVHE